MENTNDVIQESSPVVPTEDIKLPEAVEVVTAEKGTKTPDNNLFAALQEERRLRKEAELRAKELETAPSEEIYSDEGKVLRKEILTLKSQLDSIAEERELEGVKSQYPALRDKSSEFDEFRKEYPRHKLDNVAKIFLAENGLLAEVPTRKGLEKTVAGPKTPTPTGMTSEDVANLRKNNYPKYVELLRTGQLKPEDIK